MNIKNVSDLKKAYPELINQIVKAAVEIAVADALKNERCRLQDIDKIADGIDPALVNKAKFEEPIDARELAFIDMCSKSKR